MAEIFIARKMESGLANEHMRIFNVIVFVFIRVARVGDPGGSVPPPRLVPNSPRPRATLVFIQPFIQLVLCVRPKNFPDRPDFMPLGLGGNLGA